MVSRGRLCHHFKPLCNWCTLFSKTNATDISYQAFINKVTFINKVLIFWCIKYFLYLHSLNGWRQQSNKSAVCITSVKFITSHALFKNLFVYLHPIVHLSSWFIAYCVLSLMVCSMQSWPLRAKYEQQLTIFIWPLWQCCVVKMLGGIGRRCRVWSS